MKLYKAIKNNDEGVFKSPKVTGDLFGYKKVNEYLWIIADLDRLAKWR